MLDLSRDGDVFVLRLDAGENRFVPASMDALDAALDRVAGAGAPSALVITGTGKFFSNGLDLDHMMSGGGDGHAEAYLHRVLGILGRVLTFPTATVAAINGHAFGAGALMALCCDLRVMRADRGFFCMPEVDMKVPLHPGMTAILQARLPGRLAHEVIVTGRRFGGQDAAGRGIVEEATGEAELLPRATALAAERAGTADPVLGALKRGLYASVLDALARSLTSVRG